MKFIIYFIGVLLSYIVGRYVFRHISKKENLPYDWFCVILALAVSSLSLIGIIILKGNVVTAVHNVLITIIIVIIIISGNNHKIF